MNKQELIKKYEGEFPSIGMNLSTAIKFKELWVDILELDEPQKPVVKQFVADWYREHMDDLETALFRCVDIIPRVYEDGELNQFQEWFISGETKPFQTLVNMHQFGYEIEKEKRYLVKIRGFAECGDYFNYFVEAGHWAFSGPSNHTNVRTYHTRKELEEAGFGDVFDSPLFEVKEVEE